MTRLKELAGEGKVVMKNLFPKTTEEWCTKKRQFMRLLQETDDPAMAQDYENAINFCDRGAIALRKIEVKQKRIEELKSKARKRVKYVAIVISVVIVVWLLVGCQTFKGATGDSAWMLQKLSDNINVKEK